MPLPQRRKIKSLLCTRPQRLVHEVVRCSARYNVGLLQQAPYQALSSKP